LLIFLKCVVTEVVLILTVAFKTLTFYKVLEGSVATHFKCGRIFSDSVITNFLLTLTAKIG